MRLSRIASHSLTTAVTDEAFASDTCCIISYHPPLFKPLSSLTLANPLQTSLLRCAANGISVYAPHTALDSVKDGINTWLAHGLYGDDVRAFERGVSYLGPEAEDGIGGQGRVAAFEQPRPLIDVVKRIKEFLKLDHGELNASKQCPTTVPVFGEIARTHTRACEGASLRMSG